MKRELKPARTLLPTLFLRLNLILLLLLFGLYLWSAFFAQPFADDFSYAGMIKASNWWQAQKDLYLHWQGRYITNFFNMLFLNSNTFYRHYYLAPLLLLISLLFSFEQLVSALLARISKTNSRQALRYLTLGATVIFLLIIPEPDQSLFWIVGAFNYILPIILLNLLSAMLIRTDHSNLLDQAAIFSLGVLAAGCNEPVSAIVFALGALLMLIASIRPKLYAKARAIPLFLGSALSFLLVFLAPGNQGRMAVENLHGRTNDLLYSLSNASAQTIIFFGKRLFYYSPLLLVLLPLLVIFFKNYSNLKILPVFRTWRPTILGILAVTGIDFLYNFISFWSTDSKLPFRALTVPVYALFLLIPLISYNFSCLKQSPQSETSIKKTGTIIVGIFSLFLLLYLAKFLVCLPQYSVFARENQQRYTILSQKANSQKIIYLKKLTYLPWPIASRDNLVSDEKNGNFWRNQVLADYFGVAGILAK